jgi:hypothetical protein
MVADNFLAQSTGKSFNSLHHMLQGSRVIDRKPRADGNEKCRQK